MTKAKKLSRTSKLDTYQGDYIIPVIGPSGVGKSSFINQLAGVEVAKVGHSLRSCTTHLQPVEIPAYTIKNKLPLWHPNPAYKLIVVDTPGFDDASIDDSEILERITDWLVESYGPGAKLAGIIYLQEITLARVTQATKRSFQVFDKLCGKDSCRSVVLGTTKWSDIPVSRRKITEAKEQEIRNRFWKDMIKRGSTMWRVDDEKSSPWDVVEAVLFKGKNSHVAGGDVPKLGRRRPCLLLTCIATDSFDYE